MANNSLLGAFGDLSNSGLMFRNRIINGNCLIAQRGDTALVNATINYGGADRIFVAPLNFTTATGTIKKSALGGTNSGYGQWVTGTTTTGSGTLVFGQRIESANTLDFNNKTITFSGVCYQDTGSSISVSVTIAKANSADNFNTVTQLGSTGTVNVPSGVETPFSLTVTLGSSDANNGLAVSIVFPLGAVSSKNFAVSNLQLEGGPVATPFEMRPVGMELALCQRYCERIDNASGKVASNFCWGLASSTINVNFIMPFAVQKRVVPIASQFLVSGSGTFQAADGTTGFSISALAYAEATSTTTCAGLTGAVSGVTQYRSYYLQTVNGQTPYIIFSAEL